MNIPANFLDPVSSLSEVVPYGIRMSGPDIVSNPYTILKHIEQDHGLSRPKKQSLLTMLNSPQAMDHLLAGTAGAAISYAVSKYADLPKPARTLLSIAGFGVGNIIYNTLNENKFTSYDPATGEARIKLM